ncbi:MAG: substrate-binding domain-containing protein, partial [Lachnospiraceae bacterium]|nr:substrate-binding domain-containing protein [Lachnospiraceae bacterium]
MEKNYHIGVLIGNVHTQHPMELIEGICEAARDENVHVTFFVGAQGNALDYWNGTDNELFAYNYQYNSFYDYSLIAGLDAMIISYGTLCIYLDRDDRDAFASKFRSVPLVILEEYGEDSCDSFMISDNYSGMHAVMEHLMGDHGYRKILYLSGPKNNTDSNEREKAYRDVMADYGAEVTDSMVEYGDYSAEVDALVERLLDQHPDAEAMVAANDEMASSIYRVCQKRGLIVGKDLAVTGYDDVQFAQRMDPPLTTVNQDGLVMGYRALKCAVGLCKDPTPVKMKIPAQFLNRCSCGCRTDVSDTADGLEECFARMEGADEKERKELLSQVADISARNSFESIASEKDLASGKEYYQNLIDLIERIAAEDPEKGDEQNAIDEAVSILQKLCENQGNGALDFSGLTRNFHRLMNCYLQKTQYTKAQALYGLILQASDTYLQSYVMRSGEEKINLLLNRSWTGPATILYMIEKVDQEEAFYQLALDNIISQGAKSAYLYLLPEPLNCDRSSEFTCPEKMLLAAKYADGQMQTYEKNA